MRMCMPAARSVPCLHALCCQLQAASCARHGDTAPMVACVQALQKKFKDFVDLPTSACLQRMTELLEQLCGSSSVSLDEVGMLPGSSCVLGASSWL